MVGVVNHPIDVTVTVKLGGYEVIINILLVIRHFHFVDSFKQTEIMIWIIKDFILLLFLYSNITNIYIVAND